MNSRKIKKEGGRRKGWEGEGEGEGGHYPIKPSPLIVIKNSNMSNKIDYKPVEGTGVLSSSIYEDGNTVVLGASTHLALIEGGNKFAALEVLSVTNKDGHPCLFQKQDCEDGSFAVLAISALKTKKVYSANDVNSSRRLSGGMAINEILALEAGVEYKLSKTSDGFKKPFGWVEGDELVPNNSYRLTVVEPTSEPTANE
jgi:hypothetical protein